MVMRLTIATHAGAQIDGRRAVGHGTLRRFDHAIRTGRLRLCSMFTFTSTRSDDPIASALLDRYFAERSETFPQAQGTYSVKRPDPGAFVPPAGDFVLLVVDGRAAGCGGVRRIEDAVDPSGAVLPRYEIKHLWLDPSTRGRGAGRALLAELERRAIAFGARLIVLDTNESLTAAGNLYRTSGYVSVEPYNDNPNATHWYAKVVASAPALDGLQLGHAGAELDREMPEIVVDDQHGRLR
jgi:GNAT superfamily N-acetyltransferase